MSVNLLNKVSIDAGGGNDPLELTIGAAADNVSFNNMGTGLSATNVQTALKQVLAQNGYAVCDTAGNVAAKTVTITNFVLRVGSRLVIKFENQNLASSPTLNINNTGAKALQMNGVNINPAIIEEDSVFLINYNGNSYDVILGGGANAGTGISIEEYTFLAASWDDDEYSLESRYPSSRYDIIEIGSSNAHTTQAMLDAWIAADIYGYEPTNKIIARGTIPSIDIVMVLVVVDKNASNGGHTIVDKSGTSLPQRSKLKFLNAEVTDDEENDTTIVNPQGGTTIVTPPTVVVGTYTYNGSPQGPTITWATGMSDYCVVTNAQQTDAGSYQLTIALKNTAKMVWNDGASGLTTADKIYNYSIAKANQTITLSSNSVTLDPNNLTATVTVSGAQGTLSATTSDNTIATASVSGTTVTISNVSMASGSATITVTAAATTNYNSDSDTVAVTASFIPDGATITPTDDIQTWLNCGGIFYKNYTTLNQVLSDTSTLSALISDSNAVDYMARSTTWATNTCSNQTAMSYIGLNNYCSNTLLDDSTWLNAICNSTYFESVLNVKVPTMTDYTTPSGTVSSATGCNNPQTQQPWKAFDNNLATFFVSGDARQNSSYVNWKLSYTFPSAERIVAIVFNNTDTYDTHYTTDWWVDGITVSGDNNSLYNFTPTMATRNTVRGFMNSNKYNTYSISGRLSSVTMAYVFIHEIQFYGRRNV